MQDFTIQSPNRTIKAGEEVNQEAAKFRSQLNEILNTKYPELDNKTMLECVAETPGSKITLLTTLFQSQHLIYSVIYEDNKKKVTHRNPLTISLKTGVTTNTGMEEEEDKKIEESTHQLIVITHDQLNEHKQNIQIHRKNGIILYYAQIEMFFTEDEFLFSPTKKTLLYIPNTNINLNKKAYTDNEWQTIKNILDAILYIHATNNLIIDFDQIAKVFPGIQNEIATYISQCIIINPQELKDLKICSIEFTHTLKAHLLATNIIGCGEDNTTAIIFAEKKIDIINHTHFASVTSIISLDLTNTLSKKRYIVLFFSSSVAILGPSYPAIVGLIEPIFAAIAPAVLSGILAFGYTAYYHNLYLPYSTVGGIITACLAFTILYTSMEFLLPEMITLDLTPIEAQLIVHIGVAVLTALSMLAMDASLKHIHDKQLD